ncbi:MAG: hypothetical protein WBG38_12240 [Nodosilinea sp.]
MERPALDSGGNALAKQLSREAIAGLDSSWAVSNRSSCPVNQFLNLL